MARRPQMPNKPWHPRAFPAENARNSAPVLEFQSRMQRNICPPTAMLRALLLAAVALASVSAIADTDGPYILHRDQSTDAIWVCDGTVKSAPLKPGAKLKAPCGSVSGFALEPMQVTAPDTLPVPARWAAVSDIHGQAALLLSLLKAHKIVDAANRWSFGKNVLVVTGDVFDRGDTQTESLWALYRLAREAQAVGGSVQVLLGNHETMVLSGDLRYLHAKYAPVAALLDRNFPALYGADTELGRWLRTRASVLKLGDTLFLHGGLHPAFMSKAPDLAALNAKIRNHLGQPRAERQADAEAAWLYGRDGPLWYRGYFMAPRATSAEVDAQLAHFAVKRIVVGHTTRKEITSLYGGRVIGIDAGLKNGVRGELLLWDGKRLARGLPDGRRVTLPPGNDDGLRDVGDDDPN